LGAQPVNERRVIRNMPNDNGRRRVTHLLRPEACWHVGVEAVVQTLDTLISRLCRSDGHPVTLI
jgi:hypothetical protein